MLSRCRYEPFAGGGGGEEGEREWTDTMIRSAHCWLKSWHIPFNVNRCDVTDTLLLHSATEVSFQSAQRTQWSFCGTRCSRYHSKNMYHFRKLETYQTDHSRALPWASLKQLCGLIHAHDESSRTFSSRPPESRRRFRKINIAGEAFNQVLHCDREFPKYRLFLLNLGSSSVSILSMDA